MNSNKPRKQWSPRALEALRAGAAKARALKAAKHTTAVPPPGMVYVPSRMRGDQLINGYMKAKRRAQPVEVYTFDPMAKRIAAINARSKPEREAEARARDGGIRPGKWVDFPAFGIRVRVEVQRTRAARSATPTAAIRRQLQSIMQELGA